MDTQTPQLNTPPNLEPKKSWFARHMILGYVFLFAILAAAVSGIYYWQTVRQIPATVDFPVHKDLTANWQTYTNSQYGFEFKYPNDWQFVDSSNADPNPDTKINGIDITKNLSSNDYNRIDISSSGKTDLSQGTEFNIPNINLADAVWNANNDYDCVPGNCNSQKSLYLFSQHANRYYEITLYPNGTPTIDPTFSQILSTFKFTQ